MGMFGGFGFVGQLDLGQPQGPGVPGAPGVGVGGFPGIFPGGGVSNSGWAGYGQWKASQVVCTPENIKKRLCTMGPAAGLGRRA